MIEPITRDLLPPPLLLQDDVARRRDLLAAGVSQHALATRCRPSGPWQLLLPGVLLLANSPPTRRQRLRAAVLYAGAEAVITGVEALHEHGLAVSGNEEVHVLVPIRRRLSTRDFVRIERTSRPPRPEIIDGLPFAPSSRAAVDAARTSGDAEKQRAFLLAPIEAGLRSAEQIRTEINAGSQRGTAALRPLLEEPLAPLLTNTVHEGWARRITRQTPIPPPTWHVRVYDRADQLLGTADAWWDDVGLAWDFGHQRDARTAIRQSTFAKEGIVTLRTPLPHLRGNPVAVSEDLASAFLRATQRPRPPVRAVLTSGTVR
ncbi:hypothetical protein [Actinocrispum wychmicini]|uniref:Transcriptional regulator, AbiEi antitoxin, Type IV TA system n=1 Tax=Actinocrispum wychmicini TaxID=1213861 RepID=A0A4R2JZW3_9PSEU|nr:hypothetical protein [Actinocrispum wychmicini]TCO62986.1 hypothetical protein EV192_1021130 [Actinocrispum wychmicini]